MLFFSLNAPSKLALLQNRKMTNYCAPFLLMVIQTGFQPSFQSYITDFLSDYIDAVKVFSKTANVF